MNFFVAAAVAILGFLAPSAVGNTEIVNFGWHDLQELPSDMTVSNAWPTLGENIKTSYRVNISLPCGVLCDLDGTACGQDVWLGMEMPDPRQSGGMHRHTLRISWPATMPSRFDVDLYHSTAHQEVIMYARIRVASTGIQPLTHCEVDPVSTSIRFDVMLEPLVGGIIPRSLLPTLAFLTIAVPLFCVAGDRVHAYLSGLAKNSRVKTT